MPSIFLRGIFNSIRSWGMIPWFMGWHMVTAHIVWLHRMSSCRKLHWNGSVLKNNGDEAIEDISSSGSSINNNKNHHSIKCKIDRDTEWRQATAITWMFKIKFIQQLLFVSKPAFVISVWIFPCAVGFYFSFFFLAFPKREHPKNVHDVEKCHGNMVIILRQKCENLDRVISYLFFFFWILIIPFLFVVCVREWVSEDCQRFVWGVPWLREHCKHTICSWPYNVHSDGFEYIQRNVITEWMFRLNF